MELDRRQAILSVAMALVARPALAKPERIESALAECHRLTRSLIERARRASTTTNRADIDAIERLIRRTAGASGGRPVIKWLASPADAFDHLRRLNSSTSARDWRRFGASGDHVRPATRTRSNDRFGSGSWRPRYFGPKNTTCS
jgi:hypothetical protein